MKEDLGNDEAPILHCQDQGWVDREKSWFVNVMCAENKSIYLRIHLFWVKVA